MVKRKLVFCALFCLILCVPLLIIYKSNSNEKSLVQLNASVRVDESKFTISNNDTIDFVNVKLFVNENYKYVYRGFNLKAGESYSIWKAEFSDQKGRLFPQNQNPVKFSIWCDLGNGGNGVYYKKW